MGFGERQVHIQIPSRPLASCTFLADLTSSTSSAEWDNNNNYATGFSEV